MDKNVLLVDEDTRPGVYLNPTHPGKTHDKNVADEAAIPYPAGTRLTQDTGFQGDALANVFTLQPKKQRRGQWLSATDMIANQMKARAHGLVEHVVAGIKRCRIVKDVLRNTKPGFSDQVMQIACALHNLRTDFRYRVPTASRRGRGLRSRPHQLNHYFR